MNEIHEIIDCHFIGKSYRFITPDVMKSLATQESGGSSFLSKTDKQYKDNMSVATSLLGVPESQILKLITLSSGDISKFRLEPSYFLSRKYDKYSPFKRFYISSSVGAFQLMGANFLLKVPIHQWESTWKSFSGNQEAQVSRACQDFDALMLRAFTSTSIKDKSFKNLVFRAYVGYNAGSVTSSNKDALKRAQEVVNRLK